MPPCLMSLNCRDVPCVGFIGHPIRMERKRLIAGGSFTGDGVTIEQERSIASLWMTMDLPDLAYGS